MARKYTKAPKDSQAPGKKKRLETNNGARGVSRSGVVVAANPFDDDQGQQASPMHKPHATWPTPPPPPPTCLQNGTTINPGPQIQQQQPPPPPPPAQDPYMPVYSQAPFSSFTDYNMPPQHIGLHPPPPPPPQPPQSAPMPPQPPINATMPPQPPLMPPPPPLSAVGMPPQHFESQQQHRPPFPHVPLQQTYNSIPSCGRCGREIYPDQTRIRCDASCLLFYHLACSGLSERAYELLQREAYAEWVCSGCTSNGRRVSPVRYKHPQSVY